MDTEHKEYKKIEKKKSIEKINPEVCSSMTLQKINVLIPLINKFCHAKDQISEAPDLLASRHNPGMCCLVLEPCGLAAPTPPWTVQEV